MEIAKHPPEDAEWKQREIARTLLAKLTRRFKKIKAHFPVGVDACPDTKRPLGDVSSGLPDCGHDDRTRIEAGKQL